jgi:hypothetical protein
LKRAATASAAQTLLIQPKQEIHGWNKVKQQRKLRPPRFRFSPLSNLSPVCISLVIIPAKVSAALARGLLNQAITVA